VKRIFFALLLFSFLSACKEERPSISLHFENPDGSKSPQLKAELALTPSEQQLGLMYRKELGETDAMLFVFPEERPRTFWMKNTYVELDMIFLDGDLKVATVVPRAVPLTETARPSVKPAKYVLEIRGGAAEKWRIAPGSVLKPEDRLPAASTTGAL